MRNWLPLTGLSAALLQEVLVLTSCNGPSDANVNTLGSVEITARLVEIPEDAIFKRDLYDYATILKYEVLSVQRGAVERGATVYVGYYNPWKPRREAPDRCVKLVGGNLRRLRPARFITWPWRFPSGTTSWAGS